MTSKNSKTTKKVTKSTNKKAKQRFMYLPAEPHKKSYLPEMLKEFSYSI